MEERIIEARTQFDPFTVLTQSVDAEQQATIESWLSEDLVTYVYEQNPTTDMYVPYIDKDGLKKQAILSDLSPMVNGVRWNIVPGKNKIPKSLYESMMNTADLARSMQPRALSANYNGQAISQLSR